LATVTVSKSGPIRILAVDDNPAALYATTRVLKSAGYEVVQATTGSAALDAAARVDLVVLDINLPDIDGFEVCRRLRARPETAQLPVLHLSATFTHSADFELGLQAGADSYLTRPVEAPVLVATVRTLLFARHADLMRRGLDAKLRTMFKLAPVAIAMLDQSLRYESVNPAFCALAGYSPEELVGGPAATTFGPEIDSFRLDMPLPEAEPAHAAERQNSNQGRTGLKRKDGTVVSVEWRAASEQISGAWILAVTDISHQLLTERERDNHLTRERAARADAERSNRLKEEFLATLSHELRNPLNAILGWATVLSRAQDLPPPVMRGVQAIERNSRLQAQMIADLLDYAGITFGKIRWAAATIDPNTVIRAASEVVAASAAAQKVSIHTTFDAHGAAVEGDPARLQQVVWNLLSNAIKFSTEGGVIEVHASRAGGQFRLVVRDHGRGISAAFLPRIFERFSQQDSSSTKNHAGLGLGLAIVKQIVELHAGSIAAHSDGEGRGATFTVDIPLSDKPLSPAISDSQKLRSLNISGVVALVVEDDADARELTKRILTDAGAQVVEAATADAALACVVAEGVNFLISDIGMAAKDGYDLIRSLRARGFGCDVLPAIALTAFARMQDRADALAAGFQDHLVKPVDPPTLISRISSLRHRRSQGQAPAR
jgi:PAS domain S-box-containing protein